LRFAIFYSKIIRFKTFLFKKAGKSTQSLIRRRGRAKNCSASAKEVGGLGCQPSGLLPNYIFSPADVAPDVHPKSDEKIDDERRTHADERGVNEVFAHFARRDVHFVAEVLANAECVPFDQIFQPVLEHGREILIMQGQK
jgi:hypothetical protein